jgi:hypothetical protein
MQEPDRLQAIQKAMEDTSKSLQKMVSMPELDRLQAMQKALEETSMSLQKMVTEYAKQNQTDRMSLQEMVTEQREQNATLCKLACSVLQNIPKMAASTSGVSQDSRREENVCEEFVSPDEIVSLSKSPDAAEMKVEEINKENRHCIGKVSHPGHVPTQFEGRQLLALTISKPIDSQVGASSPATLRKKRLEEAARSNLKAMFKGSDDPDGLRSALKKLVVEDREMCYAMLRNGWERTLQTSRERATNLGVIGVLIFSTAIQMSVQPLESSESSADVLNNISLETDMWSDKRDEFEAVYQVLISLGAFLSAWSVVSTALYTLWIQTYVSDADDFLWFTKHYKARHWIDAPMWSCLICILLSSPCASVVIYPITVARIRCSAEIGLVIVAFVVFAVYSMRAKNRSKESFEHLSDSVEGSRVIEGFIDEAYAAEESVILVLEKGDAEQASKVS